MAADGMIYRVVSGRRFVDAGGVAVAGLRISMYNNSSSGHDFEPTAGTYPVTSAGQKLGGLDQPSLSSSETGDPRCWTSPIRNRASTDADRYHIDAGATLTLPKDICFEIPAGTTIVEVDLIDMDASYDAEVKLGTPV